MSQRERSKRNAQPSLLTIYDLLYRQYGPQHWWPAETPLEMIIGAILTQSAAWTNVEKAVGNLKATGDLSVSRLQRLPLDELARLIRPSGYYNVKARKIKAFVDWLVEQHGGDLDRLFALDTGALRQALLSVHGVGEETADSIILYAAHQPIFVIDAYTRRIVSRLGLGPQKQTYAALQAFFMDNLPHDEALFNEYHALLVQHGKTVCRRKPLCRDCCVISLCPSADLDTQTRHKRDPVAGTRPCASP
ncbi:MAG: endonuclease III domain-containing protein [Dehalococcoidia bacterium]|nr:endonuclease III domain-containing protein [Dehalococcoidia bacterium]